MLANTFLAVMPTLALQHFSVDAGFLVGLVHLDDGVPQDEGLGEEEASVKVMRAVRGIPNAEYAVIMSRSPSGFSE